MATTPSAAATDRWEYQAGRKPNTVTAFERSDRGGAVTVRWWDGTKRRFRTQALGVEIRNADGALLGDRTREAEAKVDRIHAHLLLHGTPPPRDGSTAGESSTPLVRVSPAQASAPLSIEAGLTRALRVPEGMYPAETEHVRECRRAKRDIVRAIARASADARKAGTQPTVDQATPWESLRFRAIRDIWQAMAHRYEETGEGGLVWTERCVGLLVQVSVWLHLEDESTTKAVTMPRAWRQRLARDWEAITKTAPKPEARPRHQLERGKRDRVRPRSPRRGPSHAAGREGRLRRQAWAGSAHAPEQPRSRSGWRVRPGNGGDPGRGKKKGVKRDLTPSDRSAFDEALATSWPRSRKRWGRYDR